MQRLAETFEQPPCMLGHRRSRDTTKYFHFHEDHGYETNDCRELRHHIEEAVKLGQLSHLVKGIKKGKSESPKHPTRGWRTFLAHRGILLEITIGDAPFTRTETLNFVSVRSTSPHNLLLGRTSMQKMVIMEYTVTISKKAHILELKRRHLKITILASYTSLTLGLKQGKWPPTGLQMVKGRVSTCPSKTLLWTTTRNKKTGAETFEQPPCMLGHRRSRDTTKYFHFHEDHGYETNDCRELRHHIEEAVKLGQLSHLVKGIKKGKSESPKHPTRGWRTFLAHRGILLEITIGDAPFTRTETLNFVSVRSTSPHNLLLGRTSMQKMVIMEYTVTISKKARILELKRRHLKITILTSYTSYPSRKIRRIYACTSQETTKI
nr:hypothetical protein [Tanacetum cinerariifolium]